MNRKWWRSLLGISVVLMLVLAACQSSTGTESEEPDDSAPAAESEPAEGEEVTGSLFVSGSSTVEPISRKNAEKFSELQGGVDLSVEGPGTSDGFALFCAGDSDVQDASRAIKEEEIAECEANGIEFIELYIAIDGLSVVTSAFNDQVDCLSFTDLWALLGPEAAGNGSNWTDAEALAEETAEATGGVTGEINTPYPDAPIQITAPGEESGTFDSFVELVLEAVGDELGVEDVTTTPNYQSSGDDNAIIQGIAGSEDSPETLGWVGYAYVEENLDLVRPLAVDGGDGCIEPTIDTISSGEYPIARPLFIYVDATAADENAALTAFVDFYLSDEGRASVAEVGYVDIPDEDWQATVETWESRTTGTQVGE